ncbi:hypothetical protein FDP41_008924 [Naegleria fowleri]|uniref:Thioredoxin domain-containing protein n=1 Tax=Naegleria fowleri TaxID=5763 RepID=A0A6A5BF51_NAEFO|nr:uncharacterized protein FDP41_008924 [Naegleria fowleri]KAF0972675.1 hypothetical protein FDP41_008924 [Naegleria fowleri]CAG4709703.1 unnamed protein product [Naegleria fowleri]
MSSAFEEVIVETPAQFDSTMQSVVNNHPGSLVFVYITGKKDTTTGKSWCPDCVVSEPIVTEDFLPEVDRECKKKGLKTILVKALVERSEYKGNPQYPYRTHPDLRVKSIPTFILWNAKDDEKARTDNFNDLDRLDAMRVAAIKIAKQ